MDHSIAREFVAEHIHRMREFLGLSDWRIWWTFGRLDDGTHAQITIYEDYQKATVTFDIEHPDDDRDLLDTIFHELAHILVSKFDVARDIIIEGDDYSGPMRRAWTHAGEQTVCRMEWIWRNHLRDQYIEEYTRPEGKP